MGSLSREEKKALKEKWKSVQNRKYILPKTKVKKLFLFLENELEKEPCDHTLKHTEKWISDNFGNEKKEDIIREMKEMGGYCDCEVLLNCYENYDI
ncbi:MAG: DUF2695 domain-containing protein [Lachnospiraceae bacterium]|nr:DUF2695 domain-containing protein [Lachnospiraceae bacterium]